MKIDTGYYAIDKNGQENWFQNRPKQIFRDNSFFWDSPNGSYVNILEQGSISKMFKDKIENIDNNTIIFYTAPIKENKEIINVYRVNTKENEKTLEIVIKFR